MTSSYDEYSVTHQASSTLCDTYRSEDCNVPLTPSEKNTLINALIALDKDRALTAYRIICEYYLSDGGKFDPVTPEVPYNGKDVKYKGVELSIDNIPDPLQRILHNYSVKKHGRI